MGAPKENLFGFDMLRSPSNERMTTALRESLDGKLGYFEGDYASAFSGADLFLKVVYHGITDEEGRFIGGVGLFEDNTDRKKSDEEKTKLQARLQNARKMEAIGTLAGGVAHDLNNILSGVVTYPDLVLLKLPENDPLRKPILTIQESGQKAAAIVLDLLTLARRGVMVKDAVNLNEVINSFMGSPEYKKIKEEHPNVSIEIDLDRDLHNITGSSAHLSKCIMNLIANAADATPDGGQIVVSTANRYLDTPLRGYEEIRKGKYAVLTVTDSGAGMSPEETARIFEPFYTKKVMGRSGTGLGMAVLWGAVKDHDGFVDVSGAKGKGSRFDLYFPATRQKLVESKTGAPFDGITGNEKILVVDDAEQQRQIASLILTQLGYSVETVASGEEAVEYMKSRSADLLILDMIMDPGIDGLETYKRILGYHPRQKAIIASGYSETRRVKEAQRPRRRRLY